MGVVAWVGIIFCVLFLGILYFTYRGAPDLSVLTRQGVLRRMQACTKKKKKTPENEAGAAISRDLTLAADQPCSGQIIVLERDGIRESIRSYVGVPALCEEGG